MKLRFEKNSLRYRLRKSDVEKLNQSGSVFESVPFPQTFFRFELHTSNDVAEPVAGFDNNGVVVHIPRPMADQWIHSSDIGIYHSQCLDNGNFLAIAIEKDFPCKDKRDEDTSDTFTELAAESGKDAC